MEQLRLSVIIAAYNEEHTLATVVERVRRVPLNVQIVVVNDGSKDGTAAILDRLHQEGSVDVAVHHPINRARERHPRTGIAEATGDVVVIQDADLEYDPAELPELLRADRSTARPTSSSARASSAATAPRALLLALHGQQVPDPRCRNMFTNLNLTDMETCYKMVRASAPQVARVTSDRFGFEPEVTATAVAGATPASGRCRSATRAAPTPRARRSDGATASPPSRTSSASISFRPRPGRRLSRPRPSILTARFASRTGSSARDAMSSVSPPRIREEALPSLPAPAPDDAEAGLPGILSLDLRSLALFRVTFGLVILCDLISCIPEIGAFYTDQGIMPRDALVGKFSIPWMMSLHLMSGGWVVQLALFLVTIAAVCGMILGYRTRLSTFVTWVMIWSLHNRNGMILHGGDDMVRVLLFWCMFAPLNGRWSLDAALNPRSPPLDNDNYSWGTQALMLQLCFVYWFTAAWKWGPVWTTEGSAIYYAMNLDEFVTPVGKVLLGFPT